MRVCISTTPSTALRAASRAASTNRTIANHVNPSHRCILLQRHSTQAWPFVVERPAHQLQSRLPVAAKSIHTLTNERVRENVCFSSLSYASLRLQALPIQHGLNNKVRSFYFWTYTHTDATTLNTSNDNTNTNTDISPGVTSISTETTSIALSLPEHDLSSIDSPSVSSLSASSSPLQQQQQQQQQQQRPEKDKGKMVGIYKTVFDHTGMEIPEITKRYLCMNIEVDRPSERDLDLMQLCIQFWLNRKPPLEAWEKSSQLYEQLVLSLKQQEHDVRTKWLEKKAESHVPRMTYLLNKMLTQGRFAMRERRNQRRPQSRSSEVVPSNKPSHIRGSTPSQMFIQLMAWKKMEPMLLLDTSCFNLVMQAAIDDYDADDTPMLCESIFRSMLPSQSSSSSSSSSFFVDQRTLPDAYTYTAVLRAWEKCTGKPEVTEHVWRLFNEIEQLHKDGILKTPLNIIHYNIVINALMRTQQVDWMNRAEGLFQQMQTSSTLTPDRGIYVGYLAGWLLYKGLTLEQWHRCKAVLNNALERSKASPTEPLVDASTFSHFMVKAGYLGRDDLAEQTFADLLEWYEQFPVPSMAPDVHCLRALVNLYTRTLQPDKAEQALFALVEEARDKKMPKWGADGSHFLATIKCWLKQASSASNADADEDGLERAGRLLLRALELDRKLRLNVTNRFLYLVLSAWAESDRHDAPVRAAALLRAFQSRSKKPVRNDCFRLVKTMQSASSPHQHTSTNSTQSI
jgi:hypothetical protein